MKTCRSCKLDKSLADFSAHSSGGQQGTCKDCTRSYYRQYYQQNQRKLIQRTVSWIDKLRHEAKEEVHRRKAVPCADCGQSFPPFVMDFDHVRGKKAFDISVGLLRIRSRAGIRRLLDEIKKCEVVCSNCHRIRTFTPA